jgi:PPOX class probable F420-dependent enzyme
MAEIEQHSTLIPERYQDILASNAVAHVATIGPKGEPQSSPVWFDWDGTSLRFGQAEGRQKQRNLQRQPLVAVSITDPQNPYRYIEIRGTAQVTEDTNRAFTNSLAKKYTGQDEMSMYPPETKFVVVTITPERVTHMG